MSPKTITKQKWSLASVGLRDAATDFFLSRRAMGCSPATLNFYGFMVGPFVAWLEARGVTEPQEVTARLCREFISEVATSGKAEGTVWNAARSVKTLLRFWHAEGYLAAPVVFALPKVTQKRLPCPSPDELRLVLAAANERDRCIILLMADSGLRRGEICALNWGDLDLTTGALVVRRGKGGKPRTSAVGPQTLRVLRRYRRTLRATADHEPVFQSRGGRFTGPGLLRVFQRLSRKTGVRLTPHSLRRFFAVESLRSGADPLHLARQLGHTTLTMTSKYIELVADDLLRSHTDHDPLARI